MENPPSHSFDGVSSYFILDYGSSGFFLLGVSFLFPNYCFCFHLKKPPQDLGQMSRDNSCLLKMVREGHGMTYMFKSYHLREAGQVVFLGFQPDNRSVVPVQGTLGKGQPDKGPENATFLLFTAP